jgi:hypothetical protein
MREFMKFEIRDPEWAQDLQNGLEEYMGKLYESVDAEEGTPEADPFTESGLPFCSCNVCESREILSFIAPRVIKGYIDGKIGYFDASEEEVVEYLLKDGGQDLSGLNPQPTQEN